VKQHVVVTTSTANGRPTHRNACWEGDHKRIPVRVALDGAAVCPWVTWFIDVASKVIVGVAVTPHQPARDAVLAALRSGFSRAAPYGPFGGLPSRVRVDRGKDFLSGAVARALAGFAVPVHDLPAHKPYREGTGEALNSAVEQMLLVSLPGYTRRACPPRAGTAAGSSGGTAVLPGLRQGPAGLGGLNTEHRPAGVPDGMTPSEAWGADPTPIEDVPEKHGFVHLQEQRLSTGSGVSCRSADSPVSRRNDGTAE